MLLAVHPQEIDEIYQKLDTIGCLGKERSAGYLRAAYSDEETEAMKFIEMLAKESGATSRWDQVGCLAMEWPGSGPEFVETASHVDTVPCGGNFDGAAGVVAGLAAIRAIKRAHPELPYGLRLRIWRSEEFGCYQVLYAGSRAAFGQLDASVLGNSFQGKTLEEAMGSQGADPEAVRKRVRTISQEEVDLIHAHVELHIEQGNLLEVGNIDLGVVTSIRSSKRYRVVVRGEFDHSGATPMGAEYRRDVNLAMAYMHVGLNEQYKNFRDEGLDLVQTVCVVNSNRDFNEANPLIYANATSVISGFGYFDLEIRSNKKATLDLCSAAAEALIHSVAKEYGVTAEFELKGAGVPLEQLDQRIQDVMENAAKASQVSSKRLPCGAGHDAVIVGGQKRTDGSGVPVGMLLIPCLAGKSHNPAEYASSEAIAKGATVLANGLLELAQTSR